jgi:PAS domain S-box-containing protein
VGGASRVRASAYRAPPPPPRTILRGGKLGEQRIWPTVHDVLETPHDHSALTLDFGSDSLADPDRIELQVRMLPSDDEWSTAALREARYAALIPGAYRCQVRARIDNGPWGEPVELSFVVRAAWWQSRWFWVLLGLLAIAVIGAWFSRRQRAVLRQRTRELDEQAGTRLRALLDAVPDLIIVHRDTQVIYMNVAARKLLGTDASPDATRHLRRRTHPKDLPALQQMTARALDFDADRTPQTLEVRARDADDTWRTLELSCVRLDFGGAPAVVIVARDVTERHRLRAKLVVSDRMASLGTLAAGIAHEINNPLTYVIGNLALVTESLSGSPDEDLTSALADASDGAERVRRIVSGLRTFSRGEEEQRGPIDLRGSLQAAIRLTANEVRHRARMVTELDEVPEIIADDGRLTQVFINLLVNAAHAIPEGKSDDHRITARAFTDAHGRAVVEISDTGKGMTAEVLSHVFDPFFTTKDVGVGTGLGLSICHGIVEGLGGQIVIESVPSVAGGGTNPGVRSGTTVRVLIPPMAQPAAPPARAPTPAAPLPPQRRRVMVIDDEPLVAEMLCRTLRRDHEITVESSGKEALRRIAGGARFDAIVTDVMMPNMTGLELLEELRRIAPDQARRLIFLSGGVFSAQTRVRLDELGAPQLAKPVDTNELRSCITRIAAEPQALSAAS